MLLWSCGAGPGHGYGHSGPRTTATSSTAPWHLTGTIVHLDAAVKRVDKYCRIIWVVWNKNVSCDMKEIFPPGWGRWQWCSIYQTTLATLLLFFRQCPLSWLSRSFLLLSSASVLQSPSVLPSICLASVSMQLYPDTSLWRLWRLDGGGQVTQQSGTGQTRIRYLLLIHFCFSVYVYHLSTQDIV